MHARPFLGVYAGDARGALHRVNAEPSWADEHLAFAGADAHEDGAGRYVVCGEMILDNASRLAYELGLPDHLGAVPPQKIFAELTARHGVGGAALRALGMYAVAVYDRSTRKLALVRDGVGARTMYYAWSGGACWFSSRPRTLRQSPAASDTIDLAALRDYLVCGFVPGEQTMWRDIREVRPGAVKEFPSGNETAYWEPAEPSEDSDEPLAAHAARLRPLLDEAVRCRLPVGDPVGVFLSGGLDSSLVTALAARAAAGVVHTYAIHFGARHRSELEFSGMVAAHCGSSHHIMELSVATIREMLPETMSSLDDPIGDPLTTPNLLLGRMAANDVGVILNGEGGDPCFGGPKNIPMLLHQLYDDPGDWASAYFRSFQKCFDDLPTLLTSDAQRALRDLRPPEAMLTPFLDDGGMNAYLNRLMLINTRLKGSDQILTKVSNLTACSGLIGRSPLFDRRIVEASFAIPAQHKLAGSDEKAVLKAAVADLLPAAILRRPKSGMLVPVQKWFQKDLRSYAKHMLLGRHARIGGYLDQKLIREWLEYRSGPWPRQGVKLWLVLALEIWLRAQESAYED